MGTEFQMLSVQFETLCIQLKQAKGAVERRAVLCDMAEIILELDQLLSIEIQSSPN